MVTSPATSGRPPASKAVQRDGGRYLTSSSAHRPTIKTLNKLVSSDMGNAALSTNIAIALVQVKKIRSMKISTVSNPSIVRHLQRNF